MDLDAQRELMLSGAMYDDLTDELVQARARAVRSTDAYNASTGRTAQERESILRGFLGQVGSRVFFEPTFRCEFGFNIAIGDDFFANFDCVLLDGGRITIGSNVLFGPRVGIYTSNHALHPAERAAGACYAKPVMIGDNVWIGGGVTVNPGVEIGDNAVIGSGSVVTRSIPANAIAAGVPARVLREVTDTDRTGFHR